MMVCIRTLKAPRPYTIQNAYITVYDTCPGILSCFELFCDPDSLDVLPYRKVMVYENGLRALSRQLPQGLPRQRDLPLVRLHSAYPP